VELVTTDNERPSTITRVHIDQNWSTWDSKKMENKNYGNNHDYVKTQNEIAIQYTIKLLGAEIFF